MQNVNIKALKLNLRRQNTEQFESDVLPDSTNDLLTTESRPLDENTLP